jgi:sporulation protein YlmC with PRC-barrel domain
MQLELDAPVRCGGEVVGKIADVVIDPATQRLTHIVVETPDMQARLVSAELVNEKDAGEEGVALTCSRDAFNALESVRDVAFLRFDEFPAADDDSDVGVEEVVAMPQYEAVAIGGLDSNVALTYDRIPKGEVEIRRSSVVNSADGHRLGHAEAFVVADGKVTHILLERGHLWGTRDVTIPIEAVESIATDCVTVSLSKDEVGALPSVRVHHRRFG